MPLTQQFKHTVKARAAHDQAFRRALLQEATQVLLEGDLATGRAVLRDYINATIGFEELAKLTAKPAKSVMRMFGAGGNPTARNLLAILAQLQNAEGIKLEVTVRPEAA